MLHLEPRSRRPVQRRELINCGERQMENKRDRARDIAEEGLDKIVEGDKEKGQKMIDQAKKLDPKAVEELAEEIEKDKESVERFVDKK
jgi:phage/plasmid-associated DNA primase